MTREGKSAEPTLKSFDRILSSCKELFLKKHRDYGASWLLLRWSSLVDQILIKALRIRKLEELKDKKAVPEGRDTEYTGIINYAIIALMKIWHADRLPPLEKFTDHKTLIELDVQEVSALYDKVVDTIRTLLLQKNHDYGEAWRKMEVSSCTDQLIVRLFRVKKIMQNEGNLHVSEGMEGQFSDMINYALFALIKLGK